MITVSVKASVDQARRTVEAMTTKNFNFAVARALTATAKDAQEQVKLSMPSRFTIRRTWVQNGIRIIPATRDTMTATVYSIDPFMSRQEDGADKTPAKDKYVAVPLANVRRNKKDLITKAQQPGRIPNSLVGKGGKMVASITTDNGEKFMVKLNAKKKRSKGNRLTFLYRLTPRAKIKPRLGLRDTTVNTIKLMFGQRLEEMIKLAIATARR